MYQTLSDLRILKLALAVEDSFEDYETVLSDLIYDEAVRDQLAPLFEEGPAHKNLRDIHERLENSTFNATSTEQVLQVILECERSARDLYLRYLDRVHDPRIIETLRALALEEEEHAKAVEGAIRMLKQRAR